MRLPAIKKPLGRAQSAYLQDYERATVAHSASHKRIKEAVDVIERAEPRQIGANTCTTLTSHVGTIRRSERQAHVHTCPLKLSRMLCCYDLEPPGR